MSGKKDSKYVAIVDKNNKDQNVPDAVEKQYHSFWNKCNFLKVNYHNFCLIIDGRDMTSKNKLFNKTNKILNNGFIMVPKTLGDQEFKGSKLNGSMTNIRSNISLTINCR